MCKKEEDGPQAPKVTGPNHTPTGGKTPCGSSADSASSSTPEHKPCSKQVTQSPLHPAAAGKAARGKAETRNISPGFVPGRRDKLVGAREKLAKGAAITQTLEAELRSVKRPPASE